MSTTSKTFCFCAQTSYSSLSLIFLCWARRRSSVVCQARPDDFALRARRRWSPCVPTEVWSEAIVMAAEVVVGGRLLSRRADSRARRPLCDCVTRGERVAIEPSHTCEVAIVRPFRRWDWMRWQAAQRDHVRRSLSLRNLIFGHIPWMWTAVCRDQSRDFFPCFKSWGQRCGLLTDFSMRSLLKC